MAQVKSQFEKSHRMDYRTNDRERTKILNKSKFTDFQFYTMKLYWLGSTTIDRDRDLQKSLGPKNPFRFSTQIKKNHQTIDWFSISDWIGKKLLLISSKLERPA